MIPRAVQQIYEVVQQLKQFGWEYKMEGQFLEIYNETINDLLGNSSNYGKIKHEIHHEKNGKTSVTEMTSGKLFFFLYKDARVTELFQNNSCVRFTFQGQTHAEKSKSKSSYWSYQYERKIIPKS